MFGVSGEFGSRDVCRSYCTCRLCGVSFMWFVINVVQIPHVVHRVYVVHMVHVVHMVYKVLVVYMVYVVHVVYMEHEFHMVHVVLMVHLDHAVRDGSSDSVVHVVHWC